MAAGLPPRRKCHDPLLAIVKGRDEKHHRSASLITYSIHWPATCSQSTMGLPMQCHQLSCRKHLHTIRNEQLRVQRFVFWGQQNQAKAIHGGQLHAGAWLAAAASPRLRDGFREPISQIVGLSQAEADAWDPRFHHFHVASLPFLRSISICFSIWRAT